MNIGIVIEDIWDFFSEIYTHLTEVHETSLFNRRQYRLPFLNTRVNDLILERDLQDFTKRNDVLFFEWGSELLAKVSHLPKQSGIVVRLHRYDVYAWYDKVNWDAVDKIILVSEAKQKEFAGNYPSQAHKIVVITEAIDLHKFPYHAKEFRGNLGIMCHLKPRKRVYDLILTFYELTQLSESFHLYVGGDKRPAYLDYYEAMHSLVARLNLQDKVTFDGLVTHPQEWYEKIDIFISNSYSEGLQVSPMEAIASGCYCLSHHWDGAEELLPDDNLFITGTELKEKILQYAQIPDSEKTQKIETLRQMVGARFDVDQTKVKISQLLEEVGEKYS